MSDILKSTVFGTLVGSLVVGTVAFCTTVYYMGKTYFPQNERWVLINPDTDRKILINKDNISAICRDTKDEKEIITFNLTNGNVTLTPPNPEETMQLILNEFI